MPRARIFIGSAVKSLDAADALKAGLHHDAEVVVWNSMDFPPMKSTLEAIVEFLDQFDFAVMVAGADDLTIPGGTSAKGPLPAPVPSPRDNVVLELGLFIGRLGRERAYFLVEETAKTKLPTDLAGIEPLRYRQPSNLSLLAAAMGDACRTIRTQIRKLGVRPQRTSLGTIRHEDRSAVSQEFARLAIGTLDLFAGDLSWFNQDLACYTELRKRKVRVRILCDDPVPAAVDACRKLGIELRRYPPGKLPIMKGALADSSAVHARLQVFEKRHAGVNPSGPYDYYVRRYDGPEDGQVIQAVAQHFEATFARGIDVFASRSPAASHRKNGKRASSAARGSATRRRTKSR